MTETEIIAAKARALALLPDNPREAIVGLSADLLRLGINEMLVATMTMAAGMNGHHGGSGQGPRVDPGLGGRQLRSRGSARVAALVADVPMPDRN